MNNHPEKNRQLEQHEGTISPDFNIEILNLGLDEIKEEAAELAKPETQTVLDIFEKLLSQLEPVNFQEAAFPEAKEIREKLAGLPDDSPEAKELISELKRLRVTDKIKHIVTIDQVTKAAEANNWGLCKNLAFVYLYNGSYWVNLEPDLLKNFLGRAAEKIGYGSTAKHFLDRKSLYEQFLTANFMPTPERPKDAVQINLKNGTFEVTPKGQTLRPHSPNDFLTYVLPFGYDPEATCPIFQKFLDRVLPEKEKQVLLAEFFAYVFLRHGTLKAEKVLILLGNGANGKSVVFEIANALFGEENVCSYSLKSLTDASGYYRANLQNKLLNYASEIDKGINPDILKKLASGEPCEVNVKYQTPFEIKDYATLFFNANEMPKDIEHTDAFHRRLVIISFDVTIPEEEQDKRLPAKIIENELPGVLNWALERLNGLLERESFSIPESVKRTMDEYRKESNSVFQFLDEAGYSASAVEKILVTDVYTEYRTYCTEGGFQPMNRTNFKKQLSYRKFQLLEAGGRKLYAYMKKNFLA
jgi:putative DNA primase/helicase